MKLYFAAPLFCDAEKEFNEKLTTQIEALGCEVFLPQRTDTSLNKRSAKDIFELDKKRCVSTL